MKIKLIGVLFFVGCGLVTVMGGETLAAEKFPNRTINIYIGMAAGGGLFQYTRVMAEKMTQILGVPVVVTAKPERVERFVLILSTGPDPTGIQS